MTLMALPEGMKKTEVPVKINLMNGTTIECCIFAGEGERLLELMNDHRDFIPYTDTNGIVSIIQKSTIARITPIQEKTIKVGSAPIKVTPAPEWAGSMRIQ